MTSRWVLKMAKQVVDKMLFFSIKGQNLDTFGPYVHVQINAGQYWIRASGKVEKLPL